jgi:hypothetical protein
MAARRRAQSVGGGVNSNLIQSSEFDVSDMVRASILDPCRLHLEETVSQTFDPARVLLRLVFFID